MFATVGDEATLLLPRDRRVLERGPSIDVLEAIKQPDVPATSGKSETRQVWQYQSGRFVPIDVQGGLADDRWTELLKGSLHPGDQLVTSATLARH